MKTSNSIKNSITAFISNFLSMIIGFVAQAIFINILGIEYLGLNGLFNNILNMLNVFEIGIGSAITYCLYKPIVNNNIEEVKSLTKFYKKVYNLIAIFIFFSGLSILPFLDNFIGEISVDINIIYIYILYLFSTICSYFLSYKRSILYANQKNYIINIIHMLYLILLNVSQLTVLYFSKNYYYYLVIKILCQIIENFVITFIADKHFSYLRDKRINKLDKNTEQIIFSKVRALFLHKISSVIVLGTDNIIISKYLGVIIVGYYSNYYMIISSLTTLFNQIINSTTASVGNMLVKSTPQKNFDIFNKIRFLNFYLSCFSATCLLTIMQSFISFWVGDEYLLPFFVLLILVVNYFQSTMRCSYNTFKEAAGIWTEDKYVPIIESITNILCSVIFVKLIGLAGVFLGTLISSLILWFYSYPLFVYKKLFERSIKCYYKESFLYLILFIIVSSTTLFITSFITVNNLFLNLIIKIIISILISNFLLIIILKNNKNFIYYKNLIFNKIMKR